MSGRIRAAPLNPASLVQLEEPFKGRPGLRGPRDDAIFEAIALAELTQSPLEIARSPAAPEYGRPVAIQYHLRANVTWLEAMLKARLFAEPPRQERQVRRVRRHAVQFQNVKRHAPRQMIEDRRRRLMRILRQRQHIEIIGASEAFA